MNILDLIEEANLDRAQLNDRARWLVANEYEINQWVNACELFLNNLDRQHSVPGNTVYSLIDICDQYRKTKNITNTQWLFISNNLIDYWDQMTCEARAKIY